MITAYIQVFDARVVVAFSHGCNEEVIRIALHMTNLEIGEGSVILQVVRMNSNPYCIKKRQRKPNIRM